MVLGLHHQWFPDVVHIEAGLLKDHPEAVEALRKMGHTIDTKAVQQGDAHSIWVSPRTGAYVGAADRRINGKVAGY